MARPFDPIFDAKSFLTLYDGTANMVVPADLLTMMHPTGLIPVFMVGGAAIEGVNWFRGVSQPAIQWAGQPHNSWFTAARLNALFITRDRVGSGTQAYLSAQGAVAAHIGNNGGGAYVDPNVVEGKWSAHYAAGLSLSGGSMGSRIMASMGIMPCGTKGVLPTPDTDSMENHGSGFYMSDGVLFGGTAALDEVLGWNLTILNSLTPDLACPGPSGVNTSVTARLYPPDYLSGPLGVGLQITQRAGSYIASDNGLNTVKVITIAMTPAGGGSTVTFTFQGLEPDPSSSSTIGSTIVTRTYIGQATFIDDTPTTKLSIS